AMTALRVFSLKIVEVDTERNGAKHSAAFAQLSVATAGTLFCSSSPLTASPPSEKATTSKDQAGKASTDDGARNRGPEINAGEHRCCASTFPVVDQSLSKTGGFKSEESSGRVREVQ